MNIIIVGCGKVGRTLAEQLNEEDNNVTVVDLSPAKVNSATGRSDLMGVVGNGATHAVQKAAGIDTADLLIAVTGSDELNLLCCVTAKKAGCQAIARIKNPDYFKEAPYLKAELGLAMVTNPEQAAAAEIARVLRFPSAKQLETCARGRVELLKFRLPPESRLVGLSVKDVVGKLHCDVLICTVERGDEALIAGADLVFEQNDVISLVASPKSAGDFFRLIGINTRAVKSVLIAGGGEITHYLSEMILRFGMSVKVIEQDPKKCQLLSRELPEVTVIEGDATEKDLLLEEGIATTDAFVALTNLDEENILLSLYAKSRGTKKQVTKINRIDFDDVIRRLDLDSIVCPKNVTADAIVRYVRAMKRSIGSKVEALYNVIQDKVEASEFTVTEPSRITGVPLSQLKFKENVLVASLLRNGTVLIPRGNDTIEPGDSVIIVSKIMGLSDITDVLR